MFLARELRFAGGAGPHRSAHAPSCVDRQTALRAPLAPFGVCGTIPAGAVTLGDATGTGTIRNDDGQSTVTTILSISPTPSFVGQ